MPRTVGLWRLGRVRDGFLDQFEATADEGGDFGVAVAAFHRGNEEQIKVGARGTARFGAASRGERCRGRAQQVHLDVVLKDGEKQGLLAVRSGLRRL